MSRYIVLDIYILVTSMGNRGPGSLKIKIADGGIQRSTFIVKHDMDESKISVQEPGKVSVFSRQEK